MHAPEPFKSVAPSGNLDQTAIKHTVANSVTMQLQLTEVPPPNRTAITDRSSRASALSVVRSDQIDVLLLGEFEIDIGALKCSKRGDADKRMRITDQDSRKLTLKTMNVLLELALRPNETLTREDLLDAVWPDTCPTPEVLTQAIKELRKLFSDNQKAPVCIETIPKIGYRLLLSPKWQRFRQEPAVALATPLSPPIATDSCLDIANSPTQKPATRWSVKPRYWLSLAAITIAIGLLWSSRDPSTMRTHTEAATSIKLPTVRLLTSQPGAEHSPSLSKNGAWLSYVSAVNGRTRVWVRDLSAPKALRLTSDTHESLHTNELSPQFSSDDKEIAFIQLTSTADSTQCALMAQHIVGGSLRKLMDCPNNAQFHYQWTEANEILYAQPRTAIDASTPIAEIVSLNLLTGQSLVINPGTTKEWLVGPRRSPDGRLIVMRRGVGSSTTLVITDSEGRQARTLTTSGEQGFDWAADSQSVVASVYRDGIYELARIDLNGARQWLGIVARQPSIDSTGRLAFTREQIRNNLVEYEISSAPTQPGQALFASSDVDSIPSISPNGQFVAYLSGRGGFDQVWIGSLPDRAEQLSPAARGAIDKNASSQVAPIAISQTIGRMSRIDFSPDSRFVLYAQSASGDVDAKLYEYEIATQRLRELKPPVPMGVVMRVAYDGDHLLILNSTASSRTLQRFRPTRITGGIDSSHWQLDWRMDDVMSFRRDPISQRLFFAKTGSPALFERLPSGKAQEVLDARKAAIWIWAWYVINQKLYAMVDTEQGIALSTYDLETNQAESLQLLDLIQFSDFAIDPSRQRLIISKQVQFEADIGSIQLPER